MQNEAGATYRVSEETRTCADCGDPIRPPLICCDSCGHRRAEALDNVQEPQHQTPSATSPSASSHSVTGAVAVPTTQFPSASSLVPSPLSSSGKGDAPQLPLVRELLQLHAAGEMTPEPVRLGPLPEGATRAMKDVAADIELRLGLLLAEGITRPLPYALSEAVTYGWVKTKGGASYVLGRLEDEDVIRCVGQLEPRRQRYGTRLFVPPGWRCAEPQRHAIAIELGDWRGAANIVWVPDASDQVV
jgi:hypothetical protein